MILKHSQTAMNTTDTDVRLAKLEAKLEAKDKADALHDERLRHDILALKKEIKQLNTALSRARGIWIGVGITVSFITYILTQALEFIRSKLM